MHDHREASIRSFVSEGKGTAYERYRYFDIRVLMNRYHNTQSRAFTLVELLVVIAIIGILMSFLFSALHHARETARLAKCFSNTRQISLAVATYGMDFNDYFPTMPSREYIYAGTHDAVLWSEWFYGGDDDPRSWISDLVPADDRTMSNYLDPYSEVYHCPNDGASGGTPTWEWNTVSYPLNVLYKSYWNGWYRSLHDAIADEVTQPSHTVLVGEESSIYVRLGPGVISDRPSLWWHPGGFEFKRTPLQFVDGHGDYISIVANDYNNERYRYSP